MGQFTDVGLLDKISDNIVVRRRLKEEERNAHEQISVGGSRGGEEYCPHFYRCVGSRIPPH